MKKKSVYSILVVLTLTMLLIFGGLFTASVLANDDDKIIGTYDNDQDLPGYVEELDLYKFDPPNSGTAEAVTIDVYDEGRLIDWVSDRPIAYVFVKGGPLGGYLYDYTPGAYSGEGLHVPENDGQRYQVSHITFYFAELGELLITKEFILGDIEGIVDFPATITVLVTGPSYPDGELFVIDIDASGYGDLIIENLLLGDYEVEEVSFAGSEAWESVINGSPFTVESSGGMSTMTAVSEAVEIINTYVPGSLEVDKEFLLNDQLVNPADIPDADFNFTVEVTSAAGYYAEKTGSGNEVLVFDNLIVGSYTITETAYGSEWTAVVAGGDAEVASGETATFTLENKYIPGSLEVDKMFLMSDGTTEIDPADMPADTDYSFTVEVTGPAGYYTTKSGSGDEILTFDNLIAGTYTVTETAYGSEWTAVVAGGDVEVASGETATFTLENKYVSGSLEVDKMFLMPDGMTAATETNVPGGDFYFEVTVEGPGGYLMTKSGTGDTLLTFDNLLAGSYTVTETLIGNEWTVDVDGTGTESTIVELLSADKKEITITNKYEPGLGSPPGKLEVDKMFLMSDGTTEIDPADMPADTDYSFIIEVTGPAGYYTTKSGSGDEILTFDNLIAGTYTVTETAYGSEWTAVVAGGDVEVASGETATFTLENKYVSGSLEVDKMFLMPDGSIAYPDDFDADFKFTVELRLDGDLIDTKDGEGNETLTFSGLVPGTYTVIETTYGSMWEVEIGEQSVEVIAGETATVTFINNLLTETAWAAHDVADIRYNRRGNWATYVEYERILDDGGMADIYAGQHIYVGYVEFADIGGGEVEITVYLDGWAFAPYTDNLYVQDYDNAPKGNPAPGKFDYKEEESGDGASIVVPLNNFYGIHLNVYETE